MPGDEAVVITDAMDPRVGDFRSLNIPGYRKAVEAPGPFSSGFFIAEGWLTIERLLPSRYRTRAVLVASNRLERLLETESWQRHHQRHAADLLVVDPDLLNEIVGFAMHRGIVASADRGVALLPAQVVGRSRQLIIAEGINDAENLGALCRNAVALGADGLLLDPTTCDLFSRRAVRVSVGHALTLEAARAPIAETLGSLITSGWFTVACTPAAGALTVAQARERLDTTGSGQPKVAIVVGAEGPGLTESTIEACSVAVRIPMARGIDSLNVATAAAIVCHSLFSEPPN